MISLRSNNKSIWLIITLLSATSLRHFNSIFAVSSEQFLIHVQVFLFPFNVLRLYVSQYVCFPLSQSFNFLILLDQIFFTALFLHFNFLVLQDQSSPQCCCSTSIRLIRILKWPEYSCSLEYSFSCLRFLTAFDVHLCYSPVAVTDGKRYCWMLAKCESKLWLQFSVSYICN